MTSNATEERFDPTRYWEQRLRARYSLASTGWSGLGEAFNRWSYAVRSRIFSDIVRSEVQAPEQLRVLDVGSGTGFYLRAWRRVGAGEIVGSDLTSAAVEQLSVQFPESQIHQLDIGSADMEMPGGPYDAISIIDVIYHIVDDERYVQALRNLADLLKPDGVLILSENFTARAHVGAHQISRTRDQILGALADAGLEPVAERPVFYLMNNPVSADSRLLAAWWDRLHHLVARHEAIGWLAGALLFPVELFLTRYARLGSSTRMVACRKMSPTQGRLAA
jgi:2-polyprenyl-3-methyl-5-hydroxy-6-metoxy-1,4-benzoquinol methylase